MEQSKKILIKMYYHMNFFSKPCKSENNHNHKIKKSKSMNILHTDNFYDNMFDESSGKLQSSFDLSSEKNFTKSLSENDLYK